MSIKLKDTILDYIDKACKDSSGNVISSTYLPKSGGTINGTIIFKDNLGIWNDHNDGVLGIHVNGWDGVSSYSAVFGSPSFPTILRSSENIKVYYGGHSYSLIHSGNIGSQSVNYATSSGNADTLDGLHSSDFLRKREKQTSSVSGGNSSWIRVAQTIKDTYGTRNNFGIFDVYDYSTSMPVQLRLQASTNIGKVDLNQILYTGYVIRFTKARIVYVSTWNSTSIAYLEVYDTNSSNMTLRCRIDGEGWEPITPTAGSIPSGYTYYEIPLAGNNIVSGGFYKKDSSNSYVLLGGGSHKAISDFATSSHTHSYLPLSGGTITGSLTFANGTWNVVGDDAAIGDYNVAGSLGLKSCNNNIPSIGFHNSSNTLLGTLKCEAGVLKWNSNTILDSSNWSTYCAAASHTHSYLPLSGGTLSNGGASDTSLYVRGNTTSSWVGFQSTSGTTFGYLGITSDKIPYFHNGTHSYVLLHSGNYTGYAATKDHTHSNITIGAHVSGDTKPSGYSEGLSVKNVYSGTSTGFPYDYGNSLTIRGTGTTQIMITWNASQTSSNPNVAQDVYVRSQRDSAGDNWSKWTTLITDANIGSQSVSYASSAGSVAWGNVSGKPSTFTPSSHTHDDRYYTESEADSRFVNVTGDTMTGSIKLNNNINITNASGLILIGPSSGNSTYVGNASIKTVLFADSGLFASVGGTRYTVYHGGNLTKDIITGLGIPGTDTVPTYTVRNSSTIGKFYLQKDGVDISNCTVNLPTSLPANGGNAATATSATSASYSRNLLGRNTSGTDYGATAGNLVFAEWNTHGDNRWYLKAEGYETRVGYANNAGSVAWSNVTGKPSTYSPSSHTHSYAGSSSAGGAATSANKLNRIDNTVNSTSNDTISNWGSLGTSVHFYTTVGQLKDQPSQYGLILNVTGAPGAATEVHQLWMTQASGNLAHRGGNASGWSGTWRTILDSSNWSSYCAASSHTHNYAGSSSSGGAANNSLKWGGYSIVVGSTGTDANTIYIIV